MNYYNFGFYILTPSPAHPRLELKCDFIVTVSSCLSEIYPNLTKSFWANHDEEQKLYQKELLLDDSIFKQMKETISELFDNKSLDVDGRFLNLKDAQEFKNSFLSNIPQTKIVGISIAEPQKGDFKKDIETSYPKQIPSTNIDPDMQALQTGGTFLGHDILGWDTGHFHTYHCNGLHQDIAENFSTTLNKYGLLDNPHCDVAEFAKFIEDMGEPVTWFPFAVHEYSH